MAGAPPLHQVLSNWQQQQQRQGSSKSFTEGALLVGPERDWTPEELKGLVEQGGARPAGLGDLRLRTETAAVALLSAVRLSGAGVD